MKYLAAFLALLTLPFLVPAAAGPTDPVLKVVLTSAHGTDMELPASRKMTIEIGVALVAQNFVCAQPRTFSVNVNADVADFPNWAGASVQQGPSGTTFKVDTGSPGTTEQKPTPTGDKVRFEIFWGEDRPAKNAHFTYELQSVIKSDGNPCLPEPMDKKDEGRLNITVHMPDVVEALANLSADCNTTPVPDLPECKPTVTADTKGGKSPGFEAALFLMAVVSAGILGRRRT